MSERQEGATEQDSDGLGAIEYLREEWDKRTWLGKLELALVSTMLFLLVSPFLIVDAANRLLDALWNPIDKRLPPKYKEEYRDEV